MQRTQEALHHEIEAQVAGIGYLLLSENKRRLFRVLSVSLCFREI